MGEELYQCVSGQLPTRTIPHHTGIGPDEWFNFVVEVLVGNSPMDRGPGGQYMSFIFFGGGGGGELSLVGSCPRTH